MLASTFFSDRIYNGSPDPPKYFDTFLWPSYQKMYDTATLQKSVILDGSVGLSQLLNMMTANITEMLAQ
jgi:hypothetical protein